MLIKPYNADGASALRGLDSLGVGVGVRCWYFVNSSTDVPIKVLSLLNQLCTAVVFSHFNLNRTPILTWGTTSSWPKAGVLIYASVLCFDLNSYWRIAFVQIGYLNENLG